MDMAQTYKPKNILLWRPVSNQPEALRIIDMFPQAHVEVIEHQKINPVTNMKMDHTVFSSKKTLMIGHTQSFVGNFNGCLGNTVRCCPYFKLVPLSNGCPYDCTYCYLAFIYRKFAPFIKININYDTMFKQIRKTFSHTTRRCNFNMGEMLDSLALDHVTNLSTMLVPFFTDFRHGYLMLLTKSRNINNLLTIKANRQTVVSWSLNSPDIIRVHEKGTANLTERITAAQKCQQHGYRIRFRIDPGFIYPNWKTGYAEAISMALAETEPENITLGMLRLLPGHINMSQHMYASRPPMYQNNFFTGKASDGKVRFTTDLRIEFYQYLIDLIRSFDKKVSIGICRETPQVLKELGPMVDFNKCNCINW